MFKFSKTNKLLSVFTKPSSLFFALYFVILNTYLLPGFIFKLTTHTYVRASDLYLQIQRMWFIWKYQGGIIHDFNTDFLSYPYQSPFITLYDSFLWFWPPQVVFNILYPLTGSAVLTSNLFTLGHILLNYLFTYKFLRLMRVGTLESFVGGTIFSFITIRYYAYFGLGAFWIYPLYAIVWYKFLKDASVKNALFLALVHIISINLDFYHAYFTIVTSLIIFVLSITIFIRQKNPKEFFVNLFKRYLLVGASVVGMVSLLNIDKILFILSGQKIIHPDVTNIDQLIVDSLRPWSIITPSPVSTFMSDFRVWLLLLIQKGNWGGDTLFYRFGYTWTYAGISTVLIAIFALVRRKFISKPLLFFLTVALLASFFMTKPVIFWENLPIFTPSRLMYEVIPLRTLGRYGYVLVLFILAFSLYFLSRLRNSQDLKLKILSIGLLVIMAADMFVSTNSLFVQEDLASEYKNMISFVKKLPTDVIAAPLMNSGGHLSIFANQFTPYFQIYHGKKILNFPLTLAQIGPFADWNNPINKELFYFIENYEKQEVLNTDQQSREAALQYKYHELIKANNIRYVAVWFESYPLWREVPPILKPYKRIYESQEGVVFDLSSF